MAISEDKKRLFTTEKDGKKIGISLWEIMACLSYYKRDTKGQRNLGMIVEKADINKWARHKPLEYAEAIIPDEKYADYRRGIDGSGRYGGLMTDTTGATANSMQALFLEHGFNFLTYRRPTGAFPKRILDFDGYCHDSGFWYNLEFGNMKNPYTLTYFSGIYLGGKVKYTIAIGATSSDDILDGKDIIQSIGKYAGLLIVRNSKSNSWDERLQYNGKDYVIVTTDTPLLDYKMGTTVDNNGWVEVARNEFAFNLSFSLQTNNDFDSRYDFDSWLGETIEAYPIMTNEPIFYLSDYNPETRITKLALPNGTWHKHSFTLSNAPTGTYIAPSIVTNYDVEVIGNNYRYQNISVDVIANHPYTADYIVRLNAITGTLYQWNNSTNNWQEYSGTSIPDFYGYALLKYQGERATIPFSSLIELPLPSGRYKVKLHAEGEVEYNGTHPIIGAETEKEFVIG